MAFINPKTQLYRYQSDILWETTKTNPYLKSSRKPSRNKALDTSNKNVIKAINEVNTYSKNLSRTLTNGLAAQNTYIGDFSNNKDLYDSFKQTGYNSLGEAVVELNKSTDKLKADTKEIVFVFPKVTTDTVNPEILVPFKGKILKIDAKISNVDNPSREDETDEVKLTLKHTSKDGTTFEDITSLTIGIDTTYSAAVLDTPVGINNDVLKVSVDQAPVGLKNLSVIVTVSKEL